MWKNFASPLVGVTLDVYHVWWDDRLETEIARCGRLGAIFSISRLRLAVADARSAVGSRLDGRGMYSAAADSHPGWKRPALTGMIEVEIFSSEFWQTDQLEFVKRLKSAYLEHV